MALSARDGSPAARDADDATEDLLVDTVPLIGKAEGRGGAAGGEGRRHLGSMFLLGLMNNSSFVVLAASAKDLVPGNVGLVYVCSSLPSFLLRLSAPYWLDMVSYRTRVLVASALMPAGFTLVATGSGPWQMLGIVFCSLQQGLGECSALALSSRFSPRTLTLWSSGTGLAGIFGYAWVVLLSLAGLGIRQVLLLANVFVLLFLAACRGISRPPAVTAAAAAAEDPEGAAPDDAAVGKGAPYGDGAGDVVRTSLSWRERLVLTLRLWRWTVPLFAVYAAEYAMQAGVWSAIGFPVESAAARQRFYRNSNLCYQGGVFVSRSSGTLWRASLRAIWVMPLLQCALLAFFLAVASLRFWYDRGLLALAFVAGLFGGAVYVNAFRLIQESAEERLRELSTAAGSLFSDLGTLVGEVAATVIQPQLYRANGIHD